MALSTKPYKGSRDFYPEDKRLQKYIFLTWRNVSERYGYQEYDTPLLEPLELYIAKSSKEIVDEQTYSFEDRGGRNVVIRPEMTPSVARLVAGRRQEMFFPQRLYSIPNLWRYERPQRGRLREHYQLNVDLFGVSGLEAEQEIIEVADSLMRAFGASTSMYTIKVNSRKLVNEILTDMLGLAPKTSSGLIRLIDHKSKMDAEKFADEVKAMVAGSDKKNEQAATLLNILKSKTLSDLPSAVKKSQSVAELKSLIAMLKQVGISNVEFDITLMRGFDYYTDIVFEVFDTNLENNRSMFGGGRYDGLIELFGAKSLPTIGFGMGDVTLINFLEVHNLTPKLKGETALYICLVGDLYVEALPVTRDLRDRGLNVSVDSSGAKLDKQLRSADKSGCDYALIIGQQEIKSQKLRLKNLSTGEENDYSVDEIVSIVSGI